MSSDDSLDDPTTNAAYAADTAPVVNDSAPDVDFLDESAGYADSAADNNEFCDGDMLDEMTNGTIVPGTQVNYRPGSNVNTPYDVFTAGSQHHAASMTVVFPCILGINPDYETWIGKTMLDDWGICCPHEFQIRAIHRAAFHRDELVYIIAKTGSGKSAVPLTVGSLLTGVVITRVPLVGLGSDQVSKSCNSNNYIKAYHVDKLCRKDSQKLHNRLDAMTA
jgi:hypothetical protein